MLNLLNLMCVIILHSERKDNKSEQKWQSKRTAYQTVKLLQPQISGSLHLLSLSTTEVPNHSSVLADYVLDTSVSALFAVWVVLDSGLKPLITNLLRGQFVFPLFTFHYSKANSVESYIYFHMVYNRCQENKCLLNH